MTTIVCPLHIKTSIELFAWRQKLTWIYLYGFSHLLQAVVKGAAFVAWPHEGRQTASKVYGRAAYRRANTKELRCTRSALHSFSLDDVQWTLTHLESPHCYERRQRRLSEGWKGRFTEYREFSIEFMVIKTAITVNSLRCLSTINLNISELLFDCFKFSAFILLRWIRYLASRNIAYSLATRRNNGVGILYLHFWT